MMNNRQYYKNFYSANHEFELKNKETSEVFGQTIVEYEIYKRTDVSNLTNVRGYLLIVKQRIIIPNATEYVVGATSITAYKNYPAIIENKIKLEVNNQAKIRVNSVFPRTLNSNVTTNSSSHTGTSSSISSQNTTGSSTSNVNTFSVGLAGGAFGVIPVGSLSLSYSHSWINGSSTQNTTGTSSSSQIDESFSNSMSVKDWSAYSSLSNDNKSLTWLWGQSYPWDVILYNQSSGGDNIKLPKFVSERLASDGLVLPPSEISLFGLDFTSEASWIIDFPDGVAENEIVTISHETTSYTASHSVLNKNISATLQSNQEANYANYSPGVLDLSLYSIATIGRYPIDNIATIGFKVDNFTYAPKTHTDQFKVTSPINDLQVTGTGFDSIMTTTFKSDVAVNIYFKIEDSSFSYSLNLIHWLEKNSGECKINWTINGKYTGVSTIGNIKNTESRDNSTKISLRNLDYTSVNFYDYLVLGLNTVQLSIIPTVQNQSNQYTLSSITIR